MCALLRQVAHDHLALDQFDHERLGGLATGLAGLIVVRHLGRRHALEQDVDAVDHDGIPVEHVGTARQALASGRREGRDQETATHQRPRLMASVPAAGGFRLTGTAQLEVLWRPNRS